MIIAYIITEQNQKITKLIFKEEAKCFTWKDGIEYKINKNSLYRKRFFDLKTFFCIDYIQGNPNPIKYNLERKIIETDEVPLNEIAIITKKILNTLKEDFTLILVIINLGLSGIILYILLKTIYGI